jgi:hypothetical protein
MPTQGSRANIGNDDDDDDEDDDTCSILAKIFHN